MSSSRITACLGLILLTSCGPVKSPDTGTPAHRGSDANTVATSDFKTTTAPTVMGGSVQRNLKRLGAPRPPQWGPTTSLGLDNVEPTGDVSLLDALTSCVNTTTPTMDSVMASGPNATHRYAADWSECVAEQVKIRGMVVTSVQCDLSGLQSFGCPGTDYSAANGKPMAAAAAILKGGASTCSLPANVKGSAKAMMAGSCTINVTSGNQPSTLLLDVRYGQMSSIGKACDFTTVGSQNIFGDCMIGRYQKLTTQSAGQTTSDIQVSKFTLNGAVHDIGGQSFVIGQVLPFEYNNWAGHLTVGSHSSTYTLTSGGETRTGVLSY